MVAFYGHIVQFENNFSAVAVQFLEEDRQREILGTSPRDPAKKGWILVGQGSKESAFMASTDSHTLKRHPGASSYAPQSPGGTGNTQASQLTPTGLFPSGGFSQNGNMVTLITAIILINLY